VSPVLGVKAVPEFRAVIVGLVPAIVLEVRCGVVALETVLDLGLISFEVSPEVGLAAAGSAAYAADASSSAVKRSSTSPSLKSSHSLASASASLM
jgi:hypothetical protein